MQKVSLCRLSKERSRVLLKKERLCLPLFLLCLLLALALAGGAMLVWQIALFFVKIDVCDFTGAVIISGVSFFLAGCFLFAPLWKGINSSIFQYLTVGRMDYCTLFLYYSHSKRYFFAVRRALYRLMRLFALLFLLGAVAILGVSVADVLLSVQRKAAACFVICGTMLVLLLLLVFHYFLRTNLFLVSAASLCAPLLRDRQLCSVSLHKMRSGRRDLVHLELSFLPLFLLSALLLFVPLIFVLPYYVASRVCLSYYLLSD